KDAVVSAGGEAEVIHRGLEQGTGFVVEGAKTAELTAAHSAIEAVAILAEAVALRLAGAVDPFAHRGAGGAVAAGRQLLERHGRHFDVQVDAVEHRAADPANVALDENGIALARSAAVAQVAARARVHGGDEDEAGREGRGRERPRDGDVAFLQRLA